MPPTPIAAALSLLVAAAPLGAQVADVPTRDTLGARVDIDAPGTGTAADYDGLLGTWAIRFQTLKGIEGGTRVYNPALAGDWTFRKTHDGKMVEDEFSLIIPGNAMRGMTLTYRVYDAKTKRWQIQGIGPGRGPWEAGTTWKDGDDLVLTQHSGGGTMRVRYYAVTRDHFLWRADWSPDGKTWTTDAMKIEATRK